MPQKLNCFKAYDIRGKLGEELNEDVSYRIGRAYGEFLKPQKVVIGGDVRLTSESLKNALSDGLRDAGVDVLDIGISGTEEIYFATTYLNVDGGIEVTASHNPLNYNGMKLVREGAKPISGDTGLNEIKRLAEENNFVTDIKVRRGTLTKISILDAYIDKLLSFVKLENFHKSMKIVINSGNGTAGHVVDKIEEFFLLRNSPIKFIKIHNNPDGNFPHGIPNPLLPECRKDTSDAVILHNADLGIAFDGDFDRCFFFDHKGRFIEGYYIVGLLAEAFLVKNKGEKIIHDPRLTWNTIDVVNKAGGVPVISKTGHAFIKERMREEDAIYGGEMSAHHYFRDFFYCDSGMIPWLLVTELLCLKNKKLSKLVSDRIDSYPSSGEINRVIEDPKKILNLFLKSYEGKAKTTDFTDGLSFEFDDWRFNLRTSNTESVIRLNVETHNNKKLLTDKTNELLALLDSLDTNYN